MGGRCTRDKNQAKAPEPTHGHLRSGFDVSAEIGGHAKQRGAPFFAQKAGAGRK
jgi:hypothetical protein